MRLDWLTDRLVDLCTLIWVPVVVIYHVFTSNLFLNVSAHDARGLEKTANQLLIPFQYLCVGKEAIWNPGAEPVLEWTFEQRFDYRSHFMGKTAAALLVLPPTLVLGIVLKGLAFLDPETRDRHASMQAALNSTTVVSNLDLYREIGLKVGQLNEAETFIPEGRERRPGDELYLTAEKEALGEIGRLLTEADIPWWVDCGTCLGTYRYGGVIPWDSDLDVAVLLPDFHNVKRVLQRLDPMKYIVQDWSSREQPNTWLKVYICKTGTLIDIYHFAIDEGEIHYILSMDDSSFFPEAWKIREMKFTVPVAFDTVFPLKKSLFDGVEVYLPNKPKEYLQRYYGQNLAPARVYDAQTGQYEKDLSHPYWLLPYAH